MKNLQFLSRYIFGALVVLFSTAVLSIVSRSQGPNDAVHCIPCHRENMGFDKKYRHPLIEDGQCLACHQTYDEASHQEAVKPTLEICLSCHTDEELGRSHPVGDGIIDPNTHDTMTCVSTCHLPHGSDVKYQLPYENNMDLCLSCHDF